MEGRKKKKKASFIKETLVFLTSDQTGYNEVFVSETSTAPPLPRPPLPGAAEIPR